MRSYPFKPVLVLAALSLLAPLSGCIGLFDKEVARLPINIVSTPTDEVVKEASLKLEKDDKLVIWSEMEVAYQEQVPPQLQFQIRVLKDGQQHDLLLFDPMEVSAMINDKRATFNGNITRLTSAMSTEFTIPENGTYTFKGLLTGAPNPNMKLTKAELVFKK